MSTSSEDSDTFFFENFVLDECQTSRGRGKLRQGIKESPGQSTLRQDDETSVSPTVGDQLMQRYGSKPGKGRNKNRCQRALLLNRDYFMGIQLMTMWTSEGGSGYRSLSFFVCSVKYAEMIVLPAEKGHSWRSWTNFRANNLCMSSNACIWHCSRLFRPIFQNR
jgi:hypothetical protein